MKRKENKPDRNFCPRLSVFWQEWRGAERSRKEDTKREDRTGGDVRPPTLYYEGSPCFGFFLSLWFSLLTALPPPPGSEARRVAEGGFCVLLFFSLSSARRTMTRHLPCWPAPWPTFLSPPTRSFPFARLRGEMLPPRRPTIPRQLPRLTFLPPPSSASRTTRSSG